MSTVIFVVGPSGVGKTTTIKKLASQLTCVKAIVLDNVVHSYARQLGLIERKDNLNALIKAFDDDRQRFFQFGLQALEEYQQQAPAHVLIVDVGTGFLDSRDSLTWLSQKISLCLIAEPYIAFERFHRARKLDLSYEQYVTTQFSLSRKNIYQQAQQTINSSLLSEQETIQRLVCAIIGCLPSDLSKLALSQWLGDKEL